MFERCSRCQGTMVKERFFVRMGQFWDGFHCLFCGEVVDDVILENRAFIPIPETRGKWRRMRKVEEMEVMK